MAERRIAVFSYGSYINIAPHLEPAPADPACVDRILGPARAYAFPAAYVARLESFHPKV